MAGQPDVLDIESHDLDALIREGGPVLVELWASWGGPCKAMLPILDELVAERGERLAIVKLEIFNPDKPANDEWAKLFGVRAAPTFILFNNGIDIAGFTGLVGLGEMRGWLAKNLAEVMA